MFPMFALAIVHAFGHIDAMDKQQTHTYARTPHQSHRISRYRRQQQQHRTVSDANYFNTCEESSVRSVDLWRFVRLTVLLNFVDDAVIFIV
jgi:DNA-directed RNA polymerase specialized sigma24 family protein